MTFALLPSPMGFQILSIEGERAQILAAAVDEITGARIVALLNRNGLEDVQLEQIPGLEHS